jgi:hypothetical protein
MAFDQTAYDREVIRPLRGIHGHLPLGDLQRRYAVRAGMTGAQLATHLETVRAYWRQRAAGLDSGSDVCRRLLDQDAELRRSAGDALLDPQWWVAQGEISGSTSDNAPDIGHVAAGPPDGNSGGGSPPTRVDWTVEARLFVGKQLAAAAMHIRPTPFEHGEPARPSRSGGRSNQSVPGLTVELISARPGRCSLRFSWAAPADGEVVIIRATAAPPWVAGTELDGTAVKTLGSTVSGAPSHRDGRLTLVADEPLGYHVYIPLLIGSNGTTIGGFVGFGVAEPVHRLKADRMGDAALVSWVWPPGAVAVELRWEAGDRSGNRRISIAEFAVNAGHRVDVGPARARIEVCALSHGDLDELRSPVRVATVAPASVRLRYEVRRPRRYGTGARRIEIVLTSDADCGPVDIAVVVSSAKVMPPTVRAGEIVAALTGLMLAAGVPERLEVRVPQSVHAARPYWVRCFCLSTDLASIVDPPVDSMKVT